MEGYPVELVENTAPETSEITTINCSSASGTVSAVIDIAIEISPLDPTALVVLKLEKSLAEVAVPSIEAIRNGTEVNDLLVVFTERYTCKLNNQK